jgi:hypothetical protein
MSSDGWNGIMRHLGFTMEPFTSRVVESEFLRRWASIIVSKGLFHKRTCHFSPFNPQSEALQDSEIISSEIGSLQMPPIEVAHFHPSLYQFLNLQEGQFRWENAADCSDSIWLLTL